MIQTGVTPTSVFHPSKEITLLLKRISISNKSDRQTRAVGKQILSLIIGACLVLSLLASNQAMSRSITHNTYHLSPGSKAKICYAVAKAYNNITMEQIPNTLKGENVVSWFEKTMPRSFARFGMQEVPNIDPFSIDVGTEYRVFRGLLENHGTIAISTFYQGSDAIDALIIYDNLKSPTDGQLIEGYKAANEGRPIVSNVAIVIGGVDLVKKLSERALNKAVPLNTFGNPELQRAASLNIFLFDGQYYIIANRYYKLPPNSSTMSSITVSSLPVNGGLIGRCLLQIGH